ncbi:MAG: hypothetical protein HY658_14510 [Actinobacteria bacterium]|nr:hypothetical protein [Actinomycetota bacterium]
MRRLAAPVALAIAGLLLQPAPEARAATWTSFPVDRSSFQYLGASTRWDGAVRLWPGGTATFRFRSSTRVGVDIIALGQPLDVSIDGAAPRRVRANSGEVTLAEGLTRKVHTIVVTNMTRPSVGPNGSPRGGVVIRSWLFDAGVKLPQRTVVSPDQRTVGTWQSFELWIENASAVAFDHVANGAQLRVRLDGRFLHFIDVQTPSGGAVQRTTIAWGLRPGVHKVMVTVRSKVLDLEAIVLTLPPASGTPAVLAPALALARPNLVVYGDSIANGADTLNDLDGWADRLAAKLGYRLYNLGVGSSSARMETATETCYGRNHVAQIVGADPDLVILAYGTNNMIPGPDAFGCDTTLEEFRDGIHSILSQIAAELPGVPVRLGTIPPTSRVTDEDRAAWNQVLADEAAEHGVPLVDPNQTLFFPVDFADTLHPHSGGHEEIASAWYQALAG